MNKNTLNLKTIWSTLLFLAISTGAMAQYKPQAPLTGHGAIHRNDVRIKDWANQATFEPGWIQITDTTLGKVNSNNIQSVTGPHDFLCLSLGDGGQVTCTFEYPVKNGVGPDFIVYENGFLDATNDSFAFLELAFVEVSSNGIDFVRFPVSSNIQDTFQIMNDTTINAAQINNLAGKYIANWGTPFDLEELKDAANLDVNKITHIRIIDVIGILDEFIGSRDNNGKIINDPFPTPFITCGFDLEGIAVIHNTNETTNLASPSIKFNIAPNPAKDYIIIESNFDTASIISISLHNTNGQIMQSKLSLNKKIEVQHLPKGTYYLMIQTNYETQTYKVVKD